MKRLLSALLLLAAANAAAGEKSVSLERNFGTLYGTLLTPDEGAETVAVLIAGSGPTPRNGNTNNYLYLAQELEKAGIATLRYDKRGIGSSKFDDPDKMADATLDDFIGDAAAWAEYLSRQDFRRIVLIGHSEGALIAFCAAQQCPEVDAVISLAGAGYPLDEILQLQLAAQLAPTHMELLMQARAITAALKRGERVESCPPELTPLFAPPLQTFWISSLSYDPREEIRKVRVPGTDRQRRHRLPSDARQRRRTGESPAPVPENDHRRHDPHAQKSLRPHAHGADRRLYGRYASGRSGAGRRRHRIHRRTLRFAFHRFSAGEFPSFDYFGYF